MFGHGIGHEFLFYVKCTLLQSQFQLVNLFGSNILFLFLAITEITTCPIILTLSFFRKLVNLW